METGSSLAVGSAGPPRDASSMGSDDGARVLSAVPHVDLRPLCPPSMFAVPRNRSRGFLPIFLVVRNDSSPSRTMS